MTLHLRTIAIALICACLSLLLFNAATTTIWDDELTGFFLARQPVADIWRLMADNYHEDPPLFLLWLHYWIAVAGDRPWLLRLPLIACFGAVAWGTHATARYLAGERTGWYTLIATALLPYHWLFPAALRWYALFACLAVWNFFVFLHLRSAVTGPNRDGARTWLVAYVVTGSLMWYTNYAAPLYFAAQFVVVLLWDRPRLRLVGWLAAGWLMIAVSYAPWLAVFARQLPISIGSLGASFRSVQVVVLCLYVLWAGEFSTPFAWGISVPAAVSAICAMLLFAVQPPPRPGRLPGAVLVLVIVGLSLAGVLWTKRLLLVSPFLAIWLGITLSTAASRSLRLVFAAAAIIAITGSLGNLIRRDGWLSYRWIDPIEEVVRGVRQSEPAGLVVTNAYPVLFYLHSTCGLPLGSCDPSSPAVFHDFGDQQPSWARDTRPPARVSYIHHSATSAFSSISDELERNLRREGFTLVAVEPFLSVSPVFETYAPRRFPPGSDTRYDRYRLVVAHFEKRP